MKISSQLSGIAGEYYVAAELSRRGYLAAITLRNSDGVDILTSSLDSEDLASIQVKTSQGKKKWILNKKVENEKSINKYYVFVYLPSDINQPPEYFFINSLILANKTFEGHRRWLNKLGKNGRIRKDSDARQFDPKYFDANELIGGWEELIEQIEKKSTTMKLLKQAKHEAYPHNT